MAAPDPKTEKLRLLPFRILRTADGIRLRRGATEVSILGDGAAEFIETVRLAAAGGATREEICAHFPAPDAPVVDQLLGQLVESHLLAKTDGADGGARSAETPTDIFYWQFGDDAARATERLNQANIVLVGLNSINRQLAYALLAAGVTNLTVVDDLRLRNVPAFARLDPVRDALWPLSSSRAIPREEWSAVASEGRHCVVASCDFGDRRPLAEWNAFCVERRLRFLPIVLQNYVGYVGPLVFPGETACFECLQSRYNAQIDNTEGLRAADELYVDSDDVVGFHPAMASALGDVAAFELTKFFVRSLPAPRIATQLEMNLLSSRMTQRRILKVPRCGTCSPLRTRQAVSART
jgi:bacteriocin biosynthesis cyclodehydratase domain-containing protein